MFLGPLVFSRFGAVHRLSSGRALTQSNLETVGTALRDYERAKGRFPAGTIAGTGPAGDRAPLHSWTTALLPFLGEEALYRSIDLSHRYDAPQNARAMQQDVPAFFAGGLSREKTPRGFAVSHFAGVGGGSEAGLFGRTTGITRAEVADGLSQTLVAGEIASAFPAWGEPENVRAIGRGLNREYAGFGNADGSGAMFLRADGSVRFYASGTDPDILRRLSTRDAGDVVPESYR